MVKRAILVGILTLSTLSGLAFGGMTTYTETTDVGDLPGSAVDLTGIAVELIEGYAGASDVDMFKIYIANPTAFSADTSGSTLDTQLQLFDVSGLGIYANDDIPGGGFGPSLLPANDPLGPQTAGIYYLAVSRWNNDPLSSGGEIFSGAWDEIMGPNGTGGNMPVTGWKGDTGATNGYQISLTGLGQSPEPSPTVPVPGSALLCGLGLVLSRSIRRRKIAVVA